jgi:hypothetical protein
VAAAKVEKAADKAGDKAAGKPAVPPAEIEVPLSANPTAEEMRERVLRKYTSGLR